jgi:outer membrane protein assembly factor BamB
VELDAQGRELRAHSIGNSTSTPPVFGALGWIIGLKNGTVPMAWSPSGSMVWQGPHVNGARFLEPGPKGGVFVANGQGAMVRLDPRGRQLFSSFLGGGPVAAPLVLPGGSTASCLAGSGALVVLDGGGAVLFRDDGARCTASPSLHPGGDLYLPAQGGIRRYDSKGKLLGTVPLTGSLGRALLLPDGSMAVASSSGHLAMLSSKGRLLWTFPLGRASHPPWVQASPTGGLVTTSAVGYVLAINSRGRLSWSYHHPAQAQSAWVRLDGAVLLLYPGEGLRLITPPGPPRPGSEAARP